jgi:peptidoglycan/xylan/chitin deacetylase (PgdA/CDA1 family)
MKTPSVLAAVLLLLLGTGLPIHAQAAPGKVALLDVGAAAGGSTVRQEMLALKRVFVTLGVPCDVTANSARLSDYRIVFTAGAMVNTAVSRDLLNDLFDFVEGGGVLVSAGETGSLAFPLFGITSQTPGRRRYRLRFQGSDPSLAYLALPALRTISLGNGAKHFFDDVIWTHGASLSADSAVLGVFEDGTAGLSVHRYGRGKAYLLGMSYADSVLLPQAGGSFNAERQYVNGFEPSADVIMLILKAAWETACAPSVCLAPLPRGLPSALVLTHDVDAQSSFLDSLKFAALEERYGVKSTFFVTTKYFTDESDIGYFNIRENVDAFRDLHRRGWDIGSHTVSHSTALATAPEGDPRVTRKTYDPLHALTVWGEARVSRELLEREIPGLRTTAYRSGDLAFPRSLIRILQASGYLDDSTYSANAVLTAFPYFALEDQGLESRESQVVEIPVTLDDSQSYLTEGNAAVTVKDWLTVIQSNASYGGVTVLLMHPSDTRTKTYKLAAQEALMKAVSTQGGWMGDLSSMGRFWRSRAALKFSTRVDADGTLAVTLSARDEDIDPDVALEIGGWSGAVAARDSEGKVLPFIATKRNGKVYLGRAGAGR